MRTKPGTWLAGLRMTWTIALKDIRDAIQNKTALGIMIGVGFMMLSSQALTLLVKGRSEPLAVIYDQGGSSQIRAILRARELRLVLTDSRDEMASQVSQFSEPALGLLVPAGFDDLVEGRQSITLQGYTQHWVKPSRAAELVFYFEEHLTAAVGCPVRIQVAGNQVYPNPEEPGFSAMVSTGIVLGVMTLGLILVPVLLIEEKETHTMDALMVSPARFHHLLFGKALAGLFYALVASGVIFVFSGYWIVHWWVAVGAIVLGGLCAIATGLLIGMVFENLTAVNLWAGVIILVFILPVSLWASISPKLPETLQTILRGLPSLAMSEMVGLSLVETVHPGQVLLNILIMATYIVLLLVIVGWRLRQMDR